MAKKKIICDTDVMIDYWDLTNKRHESTKEILENVIGLDNIILSAITKMELLVGARSKSELLTITTKLKRFNIALLNDGITNKGFELLEKHILSHGLLIPDCFIASTAIITKLELFTYNTRDFKFISGLKLYNPK